MSVFPKLIYRLYHFNEIFIEHLEHFTTFHFELKFKIVTNAIVKRIEKEGCLQQLCYRVN